MPWIDIRGKLPTRRGAEPYLRRTPEEMAAVRWIVYHHTQAGPGRPSVESIARYQTGIAAHLPFPAIAYVAFVEADGTAYLCHDLETVTWGQGDGSRWTRKGVGGNNWEGIAVAFSGDDPTEEQIASLKRVGDAIDGLIGRQLERVGHCDVSRSASGQPLTECPGTKWPIWREQIL